MDDTPNPALKKRNFSVSLADVIDADKHAHAFLALKEALREEFGEDTVRDYYDPSERLCRVVVGGVSFCFSEDDLVFDGPRISADRLIRQIRSVTRA